MKPAALADESQWIPASDVTLLAPLPRPGKILCVGHNYKGHIGIGREEIPEYPNMFSKTANTIIGPGSIHPHPKGDSPGGLRGGIDGRDRENSAAGI